MATVTDPGVDAVSTSNVTSYGNTEFAPDLAFTPAVGDLIVVGVEASGTVHPTAAAALTDDQSGTYTLAGGGLRTSSASSHWIFVRNQLVASSVLHTLTFTCAGDAATGCLAVPLRVAGMSKVGTNAVRQTKVASNIGAGATPAATFDAAALTGNVTIGIVGSSDNPAAVTEPSGWTARADIGTITPAQGLEVASRDSGFTGTTVTWGSTAVGTTGVIILELDTSLPATFQDNAFQADTFELAAPPPNQSITGMTPIALSVVQRIIGGWGDNWGREWGTGGGGMSVQFPVQPALINMTIGVPAPTAVPSPTFRAVPSISLVLTLAAPSQWGTDWGAVWGGMSSVIEIDQASVPGALGMTLTPVAPAVNLGAGVQTVSPAALGLTLTPVAPTALVPRFVNPAALSLTLVPAAPTVLIRVAPAAISLALTPVAPQANLTLAPAALGLTLGVPAPQVREQAAPASLGLTLTPVAPLVRPVQLVNPASLALSLTPLGPGITAGLQVLPTVLPLTLTPVAPQARTAAQLGALSLTLTPVAPQIAQRVLLASIGLSLGRPAPTIFTGVQVIPAAIGLTLTPVGFAMTVGPPVPGSLNLTLSPLEPHFLLLLVLGREGPRIGGAPSGVVEPVTDEGPRAGGAPSGTVLVGSRKG